MIKDQKICLFNLERYLHEINYSHFCNAKVIHKKEMCIISRKGIAMQTSNTSSNSTRLFLMPKKNFSTLICKAKSYKILIIHVKSKRMINQPENIVKINRKISPKVPEDK